MLATSAAPLSDNPVFTFETFVVCEGSRRAWQACVDVAEAAEGASNPLFLVGPVGSGKSHLLHAIASRRRRLNPHADVRRLAAHDHVSELVKAIRQHEMAMWRQSLATVDVLLLDDLWLPGLPRTEEEVFLRLTDFVNAGVQVVATWDARGEPALRARLSASYLDEADVAELAYPDLDARLQIVRRVAAARGLTVSERTVRDLAQASEGDTRELQAIVTRLAAETLLLPL